MKKYKYIDCHSHPHDERYKNENIDIGKVLQDLEEDGGATIAIGTDCENSKKAIELAQKHENVWATIGIHPADNHAEVYNENEFNELLEFGKTTDPRGSVVVGVGECGLDYFYFDKIKKETPDFDIIQEKKRQKGIFISQVEFAIKNNLPLVLHGRPSKNSMDAYRDMLDILEGFHSGNSLRGHAHFFVGNLEIAKRFLNLGFLMSYDGPITFSKEYDEVIKFVPIENLMIETDSPYAAPMSYRGQINFPVYVKEVAKKIAELKNLSTEEVLEITKNNAIKLFGLYLK